VRFVPVLVLQHVAVEGPGRIADALVRGGHDVRVVRLYDSQPVPATLEGVQGVVVMGGPMSVRDTDVHPHLVAEQNLISDCLDADVPLLGVCLGAQLIAATAGATVRPGDALELGWHPVVRCDSSDPLLGAMPPSFTPLHWHQDVFDLPAGAVPLASSALTDHQACRLGDTAYALLFHLEVDRAQVAAMARAFPDDVARSGHPLEQLLDGRHPAAIAPLADAAFDRWVSLLR
jgi:GMP synthase (glutamine-hydrolysing)